MGAVCTGAANFGPGSSIAAQGRRNDSQFLYYSSPILIILPKTALLGQSLAKHGIQNFLNQDTTGVDALFRGLIVVLAGGFEQLVRNFVRDSITFISQKCPRY